MRNSGVDKQEIKSGQEKMNGKSAYYSLVWVYNKDCYYNGLQTHTHTNTDQG